MEIEMRAVYVMCDGANRKIGISNNPIYRRISVEKSRGVPVSLVRQFWISEKDLAARVEIMAHALAGSPVIGREWFEISKDEAFHAIERSIKILGATLVETPDKVAPSAAQRKANKTHRQKLLASGVKPITVVLSAKARENIKRHAKTYGSHQAALEYFINTAYEKMAAKD